MKGLVIGKFMPLHLGHMRLIEFALRQCDLLRIALVVKSCDSIAVEARHQWLEWVKTQYDKPIDIIIVDEPLPITKELEVEAANAWITYFAEVFHDTDRIFSSEQYGHMLAEHMGIEHYFYDEARLNTQISGSAIRNNPEKYLDYLPEPVKRYYVEQHRVEVFKVSALGMRESSKTIRVYLPPGYDLRPDQYYPVMYLQDGQNLFDVKDANGNVTWQVQSTIRQLMDASKWPGMIVIGIDAAIGVKRFDEYSPWKSEAHKRLGYGEVQEGAIGGLGAAYAEFVVSRLKPLIDQQYRTLTDRNATSVGGSSMGAFIALYMAAKYPHIFSKVAAFSTATWFEEEQLNSCLAQLNRGDLKWYLSVGTHESSNNRSMEVNQVYLNGTQRVAETIRLNLQSEADLKLVIQEGGIHHETSWVEQLKEAIRYLYDL